MPRGQRDPNKVVPPRKPLAEIPLKDLKFAVSAPQPERIKTHGRAQAERSKVQKAIDRLVQQAYDKWVKAGQPEKTADKPPGHIYSPNDEATVNGIVAGVRSSSQFLKHSIRFLENEDREDGTVDIAFVVFDKPSKEAAEAIPAETQE
jgi:hypothetical protein